MLLALGLASRLIRLACVATTFGTLPVGTRQRALAWAKTWRWRDQLKTTQWSPAIITRDSQYHCAARGPARASHFLTGPDPGPGQHPVIHADRILLEGMIGPSSRSAETKSRRADEFDAAGERPVVGLLRPWEGGRKEWWMLMIRPDIAATVVGGSAVAGSTTRSTPRSSTRAELCPASA